MVDDPSPFRDMAERWIEDAVAAKSSSVPDVVYHYTNAAGLLGMLRSSKIWATDYRFLNDRSEIGHTKQIVEEIVSSRPIHSRDNEPTSFYDDIRHYSNVKASSDVFVFSLSEDEDDLSQWRGYAQDGQGFTVGFCGKSINDAAGFDLEYRFFQVEYDQKKQASAIVRILDDFEKILDHQLQNTGVDIEDMCDEGARFFDWCMEERALANKHKSFKQEKEWRIISYVREDYKKVNVKVRASGLRFINYLELNPRFPGDEILPIRRIGIGPGFAGTEQVDSVKAICREMGYDPEIYFADTPYRRI